MYPPKGPRARVKPRFHNASTPTTPRTPNHSPRSIRPKAMAIAAPTQTVDRFLSEISRLLREKSADQIRSYLVIEPPYASIYHDLISEIRNVYPKGQEDALETKCGSLLPEARDGVQDPQGGATASWTAFLKFVVQYFGFLRDVDVSNLLDTYNLLSELLQKANSALTHGTLGILILPTVVSYSRVLSRLAIGLDKQPHLIAHLIVRPAGEDGGARETLPERAANILRQAFVTCLNDRSGSSSTGITRDGRPEGKKAGIYTIANLCLKILFSCRKTRGAAQIFENIYNQSPPLSAYPKSERVTYLYYLGRFFWANSHFYRAQRALQKAYDECHSQFRKQKRLILIFLIASNLVCGRFPSQRLYARPEAHDLQARFEPLCRAISNGNICEFRRQLNQGSENYPFFSFFRIDLQLRIRCEVLVWRSLVRKTFILYGDRGNAELRKAPTLDLKDLLVLWKWQERKWLIPIGGKEPTVYIDPDFEDLPDVDTLSEEALVLPDMTSIFSKLSSLIHQELLNGYLSYKFQKFAIQGARQKGALQAGFPIPWTVVSARESDEVPGWKQDGIASGGFAKPQFGPGQVISLSGVRPVGM